MIITNKTAIALASLSLLGAAACTKAPEEKKAENRQNAEEKVQDKREDIAEIRTDAAEKNAKIDAEAAKKSRDTFVKASNDRLDKVKDRLDELEKRVDKQDAAVKTTASTDVVKFRGVHADVKSQLKDMDDDTKMPGWAQLQTDVDAKLTALEANVATLDQTMTAH